MRRSATAGRSRRTMAGGAKEGGRRDAGRATKARGQRAGCRAKRPAAVAFGSYT